MLDAGCGSGRVTALLIERLPEGRVIAVDGSASMVEKVRDALRPGDEALVADLTELELDEPVDAVFSSAVFHWVLDHDALFAQLQGVLRPGGRLAAQCGGAGNVDAHAQRSAPRSPPREPFAALLSRASTSPGTTPAPRRPRRGCAPPASATSAAGCSPGTIEPPEPAEFLRTVCLGPHLDRLPEELREPSSSGARARARPAAPRLRAPQHRGPRRRLSATRKVPPR